jgi:hypothetical protein
MKKIKRSSIILGAFLLGTIGCVIYFHFNGEEEVKNLDIHNLQEKRKGGDSEKNNRNSKVSRKGRNSRYSFDKKYYGKASDNINKILNDKLKFRDRLNAVHSLSRSISERDRAALYYYLLHGKNNKHAYVLKNDILNALRDQKIPPAELTDVMLDIFYDKNQDIVVRSYVLQHMRPWYLDERQKDKAIVQAFYDGLEETDTEIAGVALLALRYLSDKAPEFDKQVIAGKAVEIAENENTYILTRISAVGVCGKMGNSETLPTIRKLSSEGNPVTLRVAAISSLGEIGDSSDLDTLEKLAKGKRPYSTAAVAAIKKLKNNTDN